MLFQKGLVSVLGNAGVSVAAAAAPLSAMGRCWGLAPARLGALQVQKCPCEKPAGKRSPCVRYMPFNGLKHRLQDAQYTLILTYVIVSVTPFRRRDLVHTLLCCKMEQADIHALHCRCRIETADEQCSKRQMAHASCLAFKFAGAAENFLAGYALPLQVTQLPSRTWRGLPHAIVA